MTWIDYESAYDMVPYSWISECLKKFGIANNVQNFLNNRMKSQKLQLNVSGGKLRKADIRRGIFQGDLEEPRFLRRAKVGYKWDNKGFNLNLLLFMDDLKLFAKCKK